jgi:hypothetical protein
MLGGVSEVLVARYPFVFILLGALVAVSVTACDGGGSSKPRKARRSTTTSSSSTTSPTIGGSTGTTRSSVPPASSTTTPESRGTCGNQTDAIVAAIQNSDQGGLNTRQGQYTVQRCRLATSSPIWAAADIVPNLGIALDQSTVVLQRIGALWNVMDVGTSGVGCDAPANVRSDLGLRCPG